LVAAAAALAARQKTALSGLRGRVLDGMLLAFFHFSRRFFVFISRPGTSPLF
jgi:hypothetical protein